MAISEYIVRAEYVGTGSLKAYTFDFQIKALEDIKIRVVSDTFVKTF